MDKNVIRDMRKEADMTQMQFSAYFGIPRRTLEDWEAGRRHAPDYLIRLLRYKLEIEGLVKGQERNGDSYDGNKEEDGE